MQKGMQVFQNAKTVKKEKKITLDGKILWFVLGCCQFLDYITLKADV